MQLTKENIKLLRSVGFKKEPGKGVCFIKHSANIRLIIYPHRAKNTFFELAIDVFLPERLKIIIPRSIICNFRGLTRDSISFALGEYERWKNAFADWVIKEFDIPLERA